MTQNAIEIQGLTKTYQASKGAPAKQALKALNLDIPVKSSQISPRLTML